jgi:hypothetical protein
VVNIGLPELLLIELAFAVLCGVIARRKRRNPLGWAGLGLLFGFIPLVVVAVLPKARPRQSPGVA